MPAKLIERIINCDSTAIVIVFISRKDNTGQAMPQRELSAQQLYRPCRLEGLDFSSTADLQTLDQPLGQARALEAIEFGVDIKKNGFNVFALGPAGIGKHQLVDRILEKRATNGGKQYDWCYVSNFKSPEKPRLLKLDAGMGSGLGEDMQQLVEDLLTSLPSSFQNEEYRTRRQEIEDDMSERYEQAFSKLGAEAKERKITLLRTPAGYTLAPTKDGNIITPEEFAKLSQKEQEEIQEVIAELQVELQEAVRKLPMMKREASHRIKALNQEINQLTVEQFLAWLENKYGDHPQILNYLREVKEYAITNAEDFMPAEEGAEVEHVKQQARAYPAFQVNVFVDNTDAEGQAIVFEDNPTYQNLVGRVEYISQMGTLLTDFTLIKAGALHRANGGYLILEARKLLSHFYAWEGLKQALQAGEIKISSLQEKLSLNSAVSLEPETTPLEVKVILLGEPLLYYLLKHYDPEFRQLFHVAADFSTDTVRDEDNEGLYARLIATYQQSQELLPLDKAAVERIIEHAARVAEDSVKLSLDHDSLSQLMQEADYWAVRKQSKSTRLEDVENAISRQQFRQDKLREQLSEQILRDIRLIDTEGQKVAQVNALSVLQVGDHSFGSPTRITATARLGSGKVIDIEREVKLGGEIHSKGVMILSAYLANHYAREFPLPLSASLVFEQSYGGVDGDSASCAELCVLLSAIADIPLSQNLAVTGSMNQLGEVQAIGGVNQKIEGFFDICQARGLTGDQGVIIPAANEMHLMLREDVREAAEAGQFHVFTAKHVEDVMESLSGLAAGVLEEGRYSEGSFNRLIFDRIEKLQELHQSFDGKDHERDH
jgi:predicted ATP-dependent protease